MSLADNVAARRAFESAIELIGEQPMRFWEMMAAHCETKMPAKPKPEPATQLVATGDEAFDRAFELAEEIEEAAEGIPERGREFAESVMETASEIIKTIEARDGATPGQLQALENIRDGLRKWKRG